MVDAITSSTASASTASITTEGTTTLGQDEFMLLLLEQIKNQDPLNPQDSAEFTAQLAQFSSLEQLVSLNDAVTSLQALQLNQGTTQSASLIGKQVRAVGDAVPIEDGEAANVVLDVASAASTMTVEIMDSSGNVVERVQLAGVSAGRLELEWDGTDFTGQQLPDGVYTVSAVALDARGSEIEVTPYTIGTVQAVEIDGENTTLNIGHSYVSLGDVKEILGSASGTTSG
jgi:flagellar basal-body rod modification protein FlgD